MSVIFVDGACDLNKKQVKKLGLDMVLLPIDLNGETIKDYSVACASSDKLSTCVTKENFIKAFVPYLDNGENILYFSTNQYVFNLTDVFEIAKKELLNTYPDRKIEIYNLQLTSVVAGVLLYEVGLMYKRGATDNEIVNFVEQFKSCARGYIVTNNAKILKQCDNYGHINVKSGVSVNAIVEYGINGSAIIEYVNGRKKALNQIVKLLENSGVNLVDYTIQVSYAMQEQSAEFFKKQMEEKYNNECKVITQKMSLDNVMLYNGDTIIVGYHGKKC